MSYSFKMAGALGDIIYALPSMRAFGRGSLCLCPSKLTDNALTTGVGEATREYFEQTLVPLIEWACPYIDFVNVHEEEQPAQLDFNLFRERKDLAGPGTLCAMIADTMRVWAGCWSSPWLYNFGRDRSRPAVVIQRTPRYRGLNFPWRRVLAKYGTDAVFVGTQEEHAIFCDEFGFVAYHRTGTLLDVALAINGSKIFLGNQSCGFAIAEGMKHCQTVLEVCAGCDNHRYARPGLILNPTGDELPNL